MSGKIRRKGKKGDKADGSKLRDKKAGNEGGRRGRLAG